MRLREYAKPQRNANSIDIKWREETWRLRKLDALQGMQANSVPTWTFSSWRRVKRLTKLTRSRKHNTKVQFLVINPFKQIIYKVNLKNLDSCSFYNFNQLINFNYLIDIHNNLSNLPKIIYEFVYKLWIYCNNLQISNCKLLECVQHKWALYDKMVMNQLLEPSILFKFFFNILFFYMSCLYKNHVYTT